jgi:hypothetical protein
MMFVSFPFLSFSVLFLLLLSSRLDNLKTTKKRLELFDSTCFDPSNCHHRSICCFSFINDRNLSPDLLDLGRPTLDALALAADRNVDLGLTLHSPRALEERMARHAAGVGTLGGHQLEHGQEEVADAAGLFHAKVVFLAQHVGQGPVAQAVDVAELAFAVEDLLRPLAADAERFGKRAEQLDDLCNVVVVFAVLGAGLRVEEIVACDKLESLHGVSD